MNCMSKLLALGLGLIFLNLMTWAYATPTNDVESLENELLASSATTNLASTKVDSTTSVAHQNQNLAQDKQVKLKKMPASNWYTAQELRAQKGIYADKLPYDFGLGVVTDGDVFDEGEVSLNVKMKQVFSLMPASARDQFLKNSLGQLQVRYCRDANNNKKRLSRVKAIHGVVFDYRGKMLLKRTFNPAMCQTKEA